MFLFFTSPSHTKVNGEGSKQSREQFQPNSREPRKGHQLQLDTTNKAFQKNQHSQQSRDQGQLLSETSEQSNNIKPYSKYREPDTGYQSQILETQTVQNETQSSNKSQSGGQSKSHQHTAHIPAQISVQNKYRDQDSLSSGYASHLTENGQSGLNTRGHHRVQSMGRQHSVSSNPEDSRRLSDVSNQSNARRLSDLDDNVMNSRLSDRSTTDRSTNGQFQRQSGYLARVQLLRDSLPESELEGSYIEETRSSSRNSNVNENLGKSNQNHKTQEKDNRDLRQAESALKVGETQSSSGYMSSVLNLGSPVRKDGYIVMNTEVQWCEESGSYYLKNDNIYSVETIPNSDNEHTGKNKANNAEVRELDGESKSSVFSNDPQPCAQKQQFTHMNKPDNNQQDYNSDKDSIKDSHGARGSSLKPREHEDGRTASSASDQHARSQHHTAEPWKRVEQHRQAHSDKKESSDKYKAPSDEMNRPSDAHNDTSLEKPQFTEDANDIVLHSVKDSKFADADPSLSSSEGIWPRKSLERELERQYNFDNKLTSFLEDLDDIDDSIWNDKPINLEISTVSLVRKSLLTSDFC